MELVCFPTYVLWKTFAAGAIKQASEPSREKSLLRADRLSRRSLAHAHRYLDSQALREPTHRTPGHLAPAARP